MKDFFSNKFLPFIKGRKFGFIIAGFQLISTGLLLYSLFYLDVLPTKYLIPLIIFLALLLAYIVTTQFSKKFMTFGKIFSILLIVTFFVASSMLFKATDVIDKISGAEKKLDIVSVYVFSDDPATSINEAATYKFGISKTLDRENTNKSIEAINSKLETSINVVEFDDLESLMKAFYSKEIQSVIINQAFVSTIQDIELEGSEHPYEHFDTETKIISTKQIVTKVESTPDANVTKEPFLMYISGIDVEGPISTTSRSDVNIIAAVNPKTKQILLLSTPRDYYVPTTVSNGVCDKLTHAGIYGVDCSIGTLNMIYNININYYFRLNFTGFTEIIDALGGVTVHSDYDFVTTHGGDHIYVGDNHLTGIQALGFARERYAFADGDRQRGRDQMEVIRAVLSEASSSKLLTNYTELMDSLAGSFETSLSTDDISALVKMQLDDMATWNIQQYSVSGSGDHRTTYSMPNNTAWVMIPDTTYIENAKILINQVFAGEIINMDVLAPTPNY